MKAADKALRFSEHLEGDGQAIFRRACALGLEGIVSKRRDAAPLVATNGASKGPTGRAVLTKTSVERELGLLKKVEILMTLGCTWELR